MLKGDLADEESAEQETNKQTIYMNPTGLNLLHSRLECKLKTTTFCSIFLFYFYILSNCFTSTPCLSSSLPPSSFIII